MSIRNPVAWRAAGTIRVVKRQFAELIAREAMPCSAEIAMHRGTGESIVVDLRVAGYAIGLGQLAVAYTLQPLVVRISEIQRQAPDA
jgi:hypothetical protein